MATDFRNRKHGNKNNPAKTSKRTSTVKNSRSNSGEPPWKRRHVMVKPLTDPNLLTNYNLKRVEDYGNKIPHQSVKGLRKLRKMLPYLQRWPSQLSAIFDIPKVDVENACEQLIRLLDHRIAHKGYIATMEWFKTVHGCYLRFMCNSTFDPIPHNNLDKNGLLEELPLLNVFAIVEGPQAHLSRKFVSSALQVYRYFEPKGESPSISSIVDPFPLPVGTDGSVGNFITNVLSLSKEQHVDESRLMECFRAVSNEMFPVGKSQERVTKIKSLTKLHSSSKNGPNGPCVPMAPLDLMMLKKSEIWPSIKEMMKFLGNKDLIRLNKLIDFKNPVITQTTERDPVISRIAEKTEVGGKVRLFAIIDHMTQSLFSGLHSFLFKKLKTFEEDGTFDHNLAAMKARNLSVSRWSSQIHSVDLSTATDRLPVLPQQEVVSRIFGDTRIGELWKSIMTHRDFHYSGKSIRYSVGQPMGALSSWAMLAILHHIIVRTCFMYRNLGYKGNYLIIGDDVVLVGDDVSSVYEYIMTEVLFVPISKVKGYSQSILSNDNPLDLQDTVHSVVEIAKRVFYNGSEITGISPNIFVDMVKNPGSIPNVIPLIISKISTTDSAATLSWEVVKLLCELCFKPTLTAQMITLTCPDAVSPLGEPVSEEDQEKYCIPWFTDENIMSLTTEYFRTSLVTSLVTKVNGALDKLLELSTSKLTVVKAKNFTIEWFGYKYIFRMLLEHLDRSFNKTISTLRLYPPSFDNLELVAETITELESITDLCNVLQGSENRKTPDRIMLSKDLRTLFKSTLKEGKLAEVLEAFSNHQVEMILDNGPVLEYLGNFDPNMWDNGTNTIKPVIEPFQDEFYCDDREDKDGRLDWNISDKSITSYTARLKYLRSLCPLTLPLDPV